MSQLEFVDDGLFVCVVGRPDWLGVRVSTQAEADERVLQLILKSPEVGFVLCQPREAIDLSKPDTVQYCNACGLTTLIDWDINGGDCSNCGDCRTRERSYLESCMIHLIVVSGGVEPLHPDWVRSLRDQCLPWVAFNFQWWGDWRPINHYGRRDPNRPGHRIKETDYGDDEPQESVYKRGFDIANFTGWLEPDGQWYSVGTDNPSRVAFVRVGKDRSGRLLDDREWDEMPKGDA